MRPHANTLVLLQIGCYCAITKAETFDYVVVGGGTAGLVIANRLSETPTVRVAVIEPGGDERNNPNVTVATNYITQNAYNTPIDWAYRTVPQLGVNNEPLVYHQGKAIGGTSTINGIYSPHRLFVGGVVCSMN